MIGAVLLLLMVALALFNKTRSKADLDRFGSEATLRGLVWSCFHVVDRLCGYYSESSFYRKRMQYLRLWHNSSDLSDAVALHLAKMVTLSLLCFALVLVMLGLMGTVDRLTLAYLILFIFVAGLVPDFQLKKKYERHIEMIHKELPGFLQQLSLLLKAGATVQNSYAYTAVNCSGNQYMSKMVKLIDRECDKGTELLLAFSVVADVIPTRTVNRLVSLMTQARHTGVHNLSDQLLLLSEDIMRDRQTQVRTISEKLSTKMLMPMMVSMIGIMALLIYPIFQQL
ncbi:MULTISPECIES: type II secretion system F family protein [unclassified Fusibacter]|uniref:type II secretion system F family protein n=1 Tax=unclassified Fusibacter TaxID=2624464 RepID=UPI0010133CD2|nr:MULTISPECIES: type II secretion system F family protein [unclassified Fusibacter]MCK8060821.1 type II secretion system F family protein [Fusibacter sp. A2]NPE23117.1 type II secretion system F family protein [Fusibacter sp. A1]RXV59789.1 type II secretion system F family protein [Fusibacter sp. A1]